MIDEISDHRLQHYFQNYVKQNCNYEIRKVLHSALYCGARIMKPLGHEPAVFLLRNQEETKFYGHITCKNSWFCPTCAAKQMSKYARDVAIGLDALEKQGQSAFMITLTIPHTSGMTCEETTEILYNSWKLLISNGNSTVSKAGKKKNNLNNVFSKFCEEFNCKHRVRVGEFTHGKQGWHPHFHCLFWVDSDKFDNVLSWENELQSRWIEVVKLKTLQYWNKLKPDQKKQNETRLKIMYSKLKAKSVALYISKDNSGKIIKQKSSMYICGWGADKELTGNYQNKASHEGHSTPYQLLEKGAAGDEEAMKLFIEYAVATRKKKHARINFSKGIRDIIKLHKQTNAYQEFVKKKLIQDQAKNGKWEVLLWFNQSQWFRICELEKIRPIKSEILQLAKNHLCYKDARKIIADFLLQYNIDVLANNEHSLEMHIEDIFNSQSNCVANNFEKCA